MNDPTIAEVYRPPLFRMPNWRHMQERFAEKIVRFGLRMVPEDNLIHHARRELEIAGMFSKDSDYAGMLGESTINLMKLFSLEGHSGFSAAMQTSLFQKVSRFEPLTPLTGADDEWNEVGDGYWQNRRCSHVFKDADGRAYDIQGRIFREPSGATYTGSGSRVFVTFPYTPTSETVDVPGDPA